MPAYVVPISPCMSLKTKF